MGDYIVVFLEYRKEIHGEIFIWNKDFFGEIKMAENFAIQEMSKNHDYVGAHIYCCEKSFEKISNVFEK